MGQGQQCNVMLEALLKESDGGQDELEPSEMPEQWAESGVDGPGPCELAAPDLEQAVLISLARGRERDHAMIRKDEQLMRVDQEIMWRDQDLM
eukprot:13451626-Heterocapsa_arctica.AAC.2